MSCWNPGVTNFGSAAIVMKDYSLIDTIYLADIRTDTSAGNIQFPLQTLILGLEMCVKLNSGFSHAALLSRNLILRGFWKSGSESCKLEVVFAVYQ